MLIPTSQSLEHQLGLVRELENKLTYRLSIVSKLLDQQTTELLKDTPISLASYRILMVVQMFGELSLSEISRFNAIDRAQVTRSTAALEKQGFIEFRTDPSSKRKKNVILTKAGEDLLDKVRPRIDARRKRMEAALGPEALAELQNGLAKIAEFVADD